MGKTSYPVSEITKQELARSLKALMIQKPLERITIREITDGCGIQRQAFYYHFEDIYDLVRWMFEEEAVSLLRKHEGALLWQEGLLQLFQYLEENRAVCLCVLRSTGRSHLKRFFEADIYAVIHRTIDALGSQLGFQDSRRESELLTHFYVIALDGMVESWLVGEIDRTPEELVEFADTVLQDHIRGALQRRAGAAPAVVPAVESME